VPRTCRQQQLQLQPLPRHAEAGAGAAATCIWRFCGCCISSSRVALGGSRDSCSHMP
jgi:hypothetical protein